MSKVNGYSVYQQSYMDNAAKNKKTQSKDKTNSATKTNSTQKTDKKDNITLSDRAKALLKELQKKYNNMDFIVASYDSDEEADSYLSRGTKEYSVLIDPEELERMAADEDVKTQNMALLDEAVGNLDSLKEKLEQSGNADDVVRLGVSIGKDGEVSYFAELEKAGERQKQFIDSIRESKKEAAEEAARKAEADKSSSPNVDKYHYEHGKSATVHASTVDELFEMITNVDWDNIKEETSTPMPGGRFDFTI